jgi:hypothetical protein
MSEPIKVVRSPIVPGVKDIVVMTMEPMVINVTLPNGMIVTNPDQLPDEYDEEYENTSSESMAP